ncbi:unnamed protein product, partial [Mesorhabditis spiculigera]
MPAKNWAVGDKLMSHWNGDLWYEAKIVSIEEIDGVKHYKIHFKGWGNRYDELVSEKETATKWKEYSEEAAGEALEQQKMAKNVTKKEKDFVKTLGRTLNEDEQIVITYAANNGDALLSTKRQNLAETAAGLLAFFDASMGAHLLTKFERNHYNQLLQEHATKAAPPAKRPKMRGGDAATTNAFKPSEFYGFTHLLRIFVTFGTLLQNVQWKDRAVAVIVRDTQDIIYWLDQNKDRYYNGEEYETPPPDYVKNAFS